MGAFRPTTERSNWASQASERGRKALVRRQLLEHLCFLIGTLGRSGVLGGWRAMLRRARSTDDVPKQIEQNVQVEGLLERSVAPALPRRGAVLKLPAIGGADADRRGAGHSGPLGIGKPLPTRLRPPHTEGKEPGVRRRRTHTR